MTRRSDIVKRLSVAAVLGLLITISPEALGATGTVAPHGGYSTTTDSCIQCHDIHEAGADFALLRPATVTAVCATCHTVYLTAPTGAFDPGYPGTEAGTAAGLRAYEVSSTHALTHDGHRLGLGSGTYVFGDGASDTGSYIPGGSTRLVALVDSSHADASSWESTSAIAFQALAGLHCTSCHAPHGTQGRMIAASVNGSLLKSHPNSAPDTITPVSWASEGGLWCVGCHDLREPSSAGADHYPGYAGYTIGECFDAGCHGDGSGSTEPHEGSVTYR